jgi:hypothetical protein
VFRVPEADDIDNPLIIGSLPVHEAVKIPVFPIIIENATQVVQKAQRVIQG